jgi:quinol monooxygenase YgiN
MKTEQVVLTVQFEALPGHEAEMEEWLTGLVVPTQREEGCVIYQLHRDAKNPGSFLFYEIWTSQTALDAHGTSAHIQKFREYRATANPNCVARMTPVFWNAIP